VFCLSASAFVTPTLLGGSGVPMMAYLVYNQGILLLDWHMASTIALILLMVTAGVTLLYSWATGRGGRTEAAR
jgi:putative spermidine/putrescine transport system permease protein